MKRRELVLALVAAGCSRDRRPRLNVYNWSDYIGRNTIPRFENEFGIRVRYGVYESNEEMLAKILTGNSGWDVAFPTNHLLRPLKDMRLLARLEQNRLPNLGNLDPTFLHPPLSVLLEYGVPYLWGGVGIVYNRRAVHPWPGTWADLWRADLSGRLTMLDDPADVYYACLKKLGYSIRTQNPEHYRAAQQEALRQKPLVRAYINAEVRDQLVAGEVAAAQMWASTALQAIEGSGDLDFVYPAEGYARYFEAAVILAESRHREQAHEFLNYLLRPEVAAEIVQVARNPSAVLGARNLLPAQLRDHPVLYPPEEVQRRGEWADTVAPEIQRLRDRLWTELKAAG